MTENRRHLVKEFEEACKLQPEKRRQSYELGSRKKISPFPLSSKIACIHCLIRHFYFLENSLVTRPLVSEFFCSPKQQEITAEQKAEVAASLELHLDESPALQAVVLFVYFSFAYLSFD